MSAAVPDFTCPRLLALFLAGGAVRAELDGEKQIDWREGLRRRARVSPVQMGRARAGLRIKATAQAALWRALGYGETQIAGEW